MNVRITMSSGKSYPGGDIVVPAVKISDSAVGQDWTALAQHMKKPVDYIWREFGFRPVLVLQRRRQLDRGALDQKAKRGHIQ